MSSLLPPLPRIIISSLTQASKHLLSSSRGAEIGCLVSIGEVGERLPSGYRRAPARLRLEFADIRDEVEAGNRPQPAHIERLIGFAPVVAASSGLTLVHCQAGVSRSTAAAYILLATIAGPAREREVLEEVYAAAPAAWPNRLMVRFADDLLERAGALLRALDERSRPR